MNTADRRRLLGPSNARLPEFLDQSSNSSTQTAAKSASKNDDEIRQMFIKTGLVGNANGSAYIEIGDTIVEVSVFGPRPIRGSFIERASFSVECKFLPYISQYNESMYSDKPTNFNNNGRPGLSAIEHKILSYMETALIPSILLEKYPKSTIDIFATVVSTNTKVSGNASSIHLSTWLTNCAALALVDAGIECRDIVTSGQVRLNTKTNRLVLDPILSSDINENDDDINSIDCIFSFMNLNNNSILGMWIEGGEQDVDEDVMQKLIEGTKNMATKIRGNFNAYLMNL